MAVYPVATIVKPWMKEAQTTNTTAVKYFDYRDAGSPGSPPVTNATVGRYLVTDAAEFNCVKAFFYGQGTAGVSKAAVRIWGISRVNVGATPQDDYAGELLGQLTITLGAGTGAGSGTFNGKNFVDKISVDVDTSNLPPGIRITGDVASKLACLMIDATGYQFIIIEILNDGTNPFTGSGVGVVWRVL
jgi:hypothetical protein